MKHQLVLIVELDTDDATGAVTGGKFYEGSDVDHLENVGRGIAQEDAYEDPGHDWSATLKLPIRHDLLPSLCWGMLQIVCGRITSEALGRG